MNIVSCYVKSEGTVTANYSRVERKEMVVLAFLVHLQHGNENMLTTRQIAKKLGITPSPHLIAILKEMEKEGEMAVTISRSPAGVPRFEWHLIDTNRKLVKKQPIVIRSRGIVINAAVGS